MRRGFLALVVLLGGASVAWAQVQFLAPPGEATQTGSKVKADDVVARFMTFDANHDGRIGIGELAERMRPLVTRGDVDGDGALDQTEIRTLAVAPVTQTRRAVVGSGGYSFGDDVGLSTRTHIEGALEDLRLTTDKTNRALPIVQSYVDQLEKDAKAELLARLESVLSPQQLEAVTTVLNNQPREIKLRTNEGVETTRVIRMMMVSGDLTRRLDAMGIFSFGQKSEEAHKAIDEFKLRVRLGRETDRSELLAQLTEVLSDEELDNYRAAIERRPVVANSLAMVANTAVFRTVEQSGSAPVVFVGDVSTPGGVPVRVR